MKYNSRHSWPQCRMKMGRRFHSPIDLRSEYEVRVLFGQEVGWTTGPIQSSWQSETDLRSLLFWDVTRCRLVVGNRRFGTAYRSHLWGSSSTRIAPTLRNIRDGCRLQPLWRKPGISQSKTRTSGSVENQTCRHTCEPLIKLPYHRKSTNRHHRTEFGYVMAQAASRRPLTADARV